MNTNTIVTMNWYPLRRFGMVGSLLGLLALGVSGCGANDPLQLFAATTPAPPAPVFTGTPASPTAPGPTATSQPFVPSMPADTPVPPVAPVPTDTFAPAPATPVPADTPVPAGDTPIPTDTSESANPGSPPTVTPLPMVPLEETPIPDPPPTVNADPGGATAVPEPPPPTTPPAALPGDVLLSLPRHDYQTLNNCGPTTTMMALGMFGVEITQAEVADAMRPNKGDKNVDAAEIAAYLERYGLQARIMVGGDTQRVRRLVAAGIPVIVEQLLNAEEDIAHFRLVRGYDDTAELFISGDSYYGARYTLDYADFERLWRMFNHRYLPVWRPEQTDLVRAILGAEWDPATMYAAARDRALAAIRATPEDAAWWLALGHSEYGLGNWDAAIEAYQQSVARGGLTKRVLWYQWWPVTALNQAGRHAEAIGWADGAIASAKVYAEMRYERAVALQALGRVAEARVELQRATIDDPNYEPVRELLDQLGP